MNRERIRELAIQTVERLTQKPAEAVDVAIVEARILAAVREFGGEAAKVCSAHASIEGIAQKCEADIRQLLRGLE